MVNARRLFAALVRVLDTANDDPSPDPLGCLEEHEIRLDDTPCPHLPRRSEGFERDGLVMLFADALGVPMEDLEDFVSAFSAEPSASFESVERFLRAAARHLGTSLDLPSRGELRGTFRTLYDPLTRGRAIHRGFRRNPNHMSPSIPTLRVQPLGRFGCEIWLMHEVHAHRDKATFLAVRSAAHDPTDAQWCYPQLLRRYDSMDRIELLSARLRTFPQGNTTYAIESLLELGEEGDAAFISSSYTFGASLAQLKSRLEADRQRLPRAIAVAIFERASAALRTLAAAGIPFVPSAAHVRLAFNQRSSVALCGWLDDEGGDALPESLARGISSLAAMCSELCEGRSGQAHDTLSIASGGEPGQPSVSGNELLAQTDNAELERFWSLAAEASVDLPLLGGEEVD